MKPYSSALQFLCYVLTCTSMWAAADPAAFDRPQYRW